MEALSALVVEWEVDLGEMAPSSRVVYRRSVAQFGAFLDQHHPDITELDQITQRHVKLWMIAMADAGRSDATRRVRLAGLRSFFAFLIEDPTIPVVKNPTIGVPLPTVRVQPVAVTPDADLAKLIASIEKAPSLHKRDPFNNTRDAAIIRVLISIGCRRSELCGLDVADVDTKERTLALRKTKNGRARVVDMGGDKTLRAILRYLRARNLHAGKDDPALFLSDRESPTFGWRLTGEGIAAMLERRTQKVGIPKIRPHQLRHTAAHDLLANGALEIEVERIFGWSGGMMVRRYGASMADERARAKSRLLKRGDRF
ncbi:MAG TPA: tyrosine-type recombinase/integrase [Pseudonocardia sp.]|jgi:site-specific recombinase XerD|nr:tyrosine-type recombinase/integrase [Pseudonocardia sp.]